MPPSLRDDAAKYAAQGFPIIPIKITLDNGVKVVSVPLDKKELAAARKQIPSDEFLDEWFTEGGKRFGDANAFGVPIEKTEFGVDTDGEGKDLFLSEILGNGRVSESLKDSFNTTMATKTVHGGIHWGFRIKPEDFPNGISTEGKHNLVISKHNEIKIMGRGLQLFERGPGYEPIRGPECIVTLERTQVNELLTVLESFKKEFDKTKLEADTITDIAKTLVPYYRPGHRDSIIFSITGPLFKGRTPNQTIKNIAQRLVDLTNYSDENINKIFDTIDQKYTRNPDSDEVNGWSLFIQALEDARPESITDPNHAAKVIDQIERKLNRIGLYEMSYSRAYNNSNNSNNNNSKYQFSPEINQQLEGHIYKITRPGPPIGMILADINQQKIFRATIPVVKNKSSEQNTTDGTSTTRTQLQVSKTLHYVELIIDATPDKIKIYDNPIDTSAPRRYQITWNTRSSLPTKRGTFLTGQGSIESTLQELENKNMIIKKLSARDALAAIISAIETEGDGQKIEIDETVETSGYYLINGKFITRNITQQNLDKEPDRNLVLECVELLDTLSTKWKDLTKFPTVIKWAVLAPFNYILKTSTKDSNSSKWLPLIHMHNWSSSGKSSLGKIALAIWRKHGTLDKKDHQIGFSNIDTEARFGTVISKTTYPILVNEVGALSAQGDRYQWLVELIKIAVESPNTRGKYMEKRYTSIPALSALIFTSNPKPPKDSGYRTRAIIMHFSKNEVHPRGSDEAVEFEKYLNSKLHLLGVLGDFIAREFIEKYKDDAEESPLFSPNKSFDEISKDIISAFYKLAGKDTPEWLDRLTQQANVVEDHTEEAYLELRSFLIKEITDAYSRHNKALYNSKTDPDPSLNIVDMSTRLDFCLKNTLVPFLHLKDFESSEVLITADIFSAMERAGKKIEGLVTLEDLKNELGESFQHNSAKIGGQKRKVIRGTRGDFTNFLQGKVGDIIND